MAAVANWKELEDLGSLCSKVNESRYANEHNPRGLGCYLGGRKPNVYPPKRGWFYPWSPCVKFNQTFWNDGEPDNKTFWDDGESNNKTHWDDGEWQHDNKTDWDGGEWQHDNKTWKDGDHDHKYNKTGRETCLSIKYGSEEQAKNHTMLPYMLSDLGGDIKLPFICALKRCDKVGCDLDWTCKTEGDKWAKCSTDYSEAVGYKCDCSEKFKDDSAGTCVWKDQHKDWNGQHKDHN